MRDHEVYELAYKKRKITYLPHYKKHDLYGKPQFKYNKYGLEAWRFAALYKELRHMKVEKKQELFKKLPDDLIDNIKSTNLKNYVKTAKGLLNMMLTQIVY